MKLNPLVKSTLIFCFSTALALASPNLVEMNLNEVEPVALELKQRAPNWQPQVVDYYDNGNTKDVIFFEPKGEMERVPVKHLEFYADGNLQVEEDLALEPIHQEPVPHGLSISYFPTGVVKEVVNYRIRVEKLISQICLNR
jgi:hypothetical protein